MTNSLRQSASMLTVAACLALAASPALGQSFQGTSNVVFGSADVNVLPVNGVVSTNVTVNSASAVIDWLPTDTAIANGLPIEFQTQSTQANFSNSAPGSNFVVLNRIVPADTSRPVQFNGTVVSRLQTAAGSTPGGTVFFYSPGGIILGANAVFDVGNLGLTTANPAVDAAGNWLVGDAVNLQSANPTSRIRIEPGASILASADNSYVALFAPRISHSGSINVNGQAALAVGEAGTLTFSPDGLFDIQITVGASGAQGGGLDNNGSIGGPASSGAGDNHRIYMVTAARNDLVTMAITSGSELGFDIAGAAQVEGNAIILTAGHDIAGGEVVAAASVSGVNNIVIGDGAASNLSPIVFTSAVEATARGSALVETFGTTIFHGDASFTAAQATLGLRSNAAGVAGSLIADGDLTFKALAVGTNPGSVVASMQAATQANIGGALLLDGSGRLDLAGTGQVRAAAAVLSISGANLNVLGDVRLDTTAISNAPNTSARAANSTVQVVNSSQVTIGGLLRLDASATVLQSGSAIAANSGIDVVSGTVLSAGSLQMLSDAKGGLGGGSATGGAVQLFVGNPGAQVNIASAPAVGPMIASRAIGGDAAAAGQAGGNAISGFTGITVSAGGTANLPLNIASPVRLESTAIGGSAFGDGGAGGTARLGAMNIFTNVGTTKSTINVGALEMVQIARGGDAFGTTPGSNGGRAFGGQLVFELVNTNFTAASINAEMSLTGGNGINGGVVDAVGAMFLRANASTATVSGTTRFSSTMTGGNGRLGGTGGNATSGGFFIDPVNAATPSLIDLQDLLVDFRATGGSGGDNPAAAGGGGGAANGNTVLLLGSAVNGTLVVGGSTQISTQSFAGLGGNGLTGGFGGNGIAGSVQIGTKSGVGTVTSLGGSASFGDVQLVADAYGGAGGSGQGGGGGNGGIGTGGTVLVVGRGAPVSAGTISVSARGRGGNGGSSAAAAGAGGDGLSGRATLAVSNAQNHPGRGSAEIAAINFQVGGTGGNGSTQGVSFLTNGGGIDLTLADVTVGTFNMVDSGTVAIAGAPTAALRLNDASYTGNSLSLLIGSVFSPLLNLAAIDVDTIVLNVASYQTAPATTEEVTINADTSFTINAQNGVSLGTAVSSPAISVRSASLQFTGDGGFDTGAAGSVSLESTNMAGTFLSATAGPPQAGYHLSEATIAKINTAILNVAAGANAGGEFDLQLGNMDFTVSANLSQVNFSTTDNEGATRIGGDVRFAGGGISFLTDLFILDNAVGSIEASTLAITARNIGIISPEILALFDNDQVPANLAELVNTPSALADGEPVISADHVDFAFGELLLVQNTGTLDEPAGIQVGPEGLSITPNGQAAPTVILNGQIADDAGNVTGADAADAFIAALASPTGFADDSLINGCAITALTCAAAPGLSQNPILTAAGVTENQVVAAISAEVQVVGNSPSSSGSASAAASPGSSSSAAGAIAGSTGSAANLDIAAETDAGGGAADATFDAEPDSGASADAQDDTETSAEDEVAAQDEAAEASAEEDEPADEEQDEDDEEEDEEDDGPTTGPILAPPMLIDTGPLTPAPVVTEPFSSAGNPALHDNSGPDGDIDGERN